MSSRFEQILHSKYQQLTEQPAVASTAQPTQQAPTNTAAAPQQQQTQQPPQQQQQQVKPEQILAQAFKTMKFTDGNQATQVLNNAVKAAGNVQGMSDFFSNIGYDPNKGFIYVTPQQQKAQQPQPQSTGTTNVGTPGTTATNTARGV